MRQCKKCKGPVWMPGDERRGMSQKRLCNRCWGLLLARSSEGETLKSLASEFCISVGAISQKHRMLKEAGAR